MVGICAEQDKKYRYRIGVSCTKHCQPQVAVVLGLKTHFAMCKSHYPNPTLAAYTAVFSKSQFPLAEKNEVAGVLPSNAANADKSCV